MLTVRSLSAGYGALTILHDVSLFLNVGEAVAVVGANGAGKTTLVRAICGLIRPKSGEIWKSGQNIAGLAAHRLPSLGLAVVLENRHLFSELTIRENLLLAEAVGSSAQREGNRFTWEEVCKLFPVVEQRLESRVELLSGGEQQMVAIARALLLQPDLLVMDEPSTGLAPKVVKDILAVIVALRARGLSLLVVEQNVGIASEISNRAYVMALGRIVHEVPNGQWPAFLADERLVAAYLGA